MNIDELRSLWDAVGHTIAIVEVQIGSNGTKESRPLYLIDFADLSITDISEGMRGRYSELHVCPPYMAFSPHLQNKAVPMGILEVMVSKISRIKALQRVEKGEKTDLKIIEVCYQNDYGGEDSVLGYLTSKDDATDTSSVEIARLRSSDETIGDKILIRKPTQIIRFKNATISTPQP